MADGAAKPEMLINIDSFTIILLVLPLSWFFGRFHMMVALVTGMIIGLVGFIGSGLTPVGAVVAFMIFVFAIGEIICSPKFSEYIGMIAPADKKALYMGYSNIPFAIGWAAGNGLSGPLYDTFSSKTVFARRYLVDKFGMAADEAARIDPNQLMATLVDKVGGGATVYDVNKLLWDAYNPWVVWLLLGVVGLASLIGMVVNFRRSKA
jgi:MFS family permease